MNNDKITFVCDDVELSLVSRCLHYALFSPSFILSQQEKIALVDLYRKTFKIAVQ